MNAPHLQDCQL
jgi:hypothetical protein